MTLRKASRSALTLLEVLIALVIFLVGVVALYQLVQTGTNHAARIEQKSLASLRCQSKLDEIVVGAEALTSGDFQPFPDDATWQWRLLATEEFDGLYKVQVEVRRELANGDIIETSLARFLIPPSRRGSSLDAFGALPSTSSGSTTPSTEGSTMPSTGGTTPPATGGTTPPTTPTTPMTPMTPGGGGTTKGGTKGGTKG